MKRIISLKRILPCIAALLVLTNCKNLFQPQKLPPTATAQTGEGTFTLEIGGIRAGRTILPATVQNDFAAYTLVFQAEGKTDLSADRTNANLAGAISLPAGTWNLTVTAFLDYNKTKPAAQGTITDIEISAGGNTSSRLELTPIIEAGATGTFRWNIDYPTDVTSASMTITPLDEATGTAAQTLYFKGGIPPTDKNNAYAPLALKTGYYRVVFNLSKGAIATGREEYLHIYKNLESWFEYTFTQDYFTVYSVVSQGDSGPGSLRNAIANAVANSTILVEVGMINLESRLEISKNLTIRGNGVTLTRSAVWTGTSSSSQLLYIPSSRAAITVNISRVHFKNGSATSYGAAIYSSDETVNLESCIFSGNRTIISDDGGGAIFNYGTMNIKGCTFYNNSTPGSGGSIYNYGGTLTLTGNLFYGNTAANGGPVVYRGGGRVTSNGYNVADVVLGTGTDQSGWSSATGDKTITAGSWPVSPVSFKLTSGSGAGAVITTLPTGYPAADFYGAAISSGAAAGAVQSAASGYVLDFSVNNSSMGSVSATPAPDAEGLVPAGTVSLTASPAEGHELLYWLVNGVKAGSANPLSRSISAYTTIQAVFYRPVTVTAFTDAAGSATTPGTLRYALTNAQDGDVIRFTGVTAGTTTIELGSALPDVTKSVTIEGNGVTLTRSAAWTETINDPQLLYISNSSGPVNISRVHFKNGRATSYGPAIYHGGKTVNLESCIFSGNQSSSGSGGAIYNIGTMNIKGSTFYNNSTAGSGGAIYNSIGTLTLTGNLFYGNTAANGYPVVYNGYNTTVTSNGYNAVDVALGTGTAQSGWTSATGDKTITAGSWPVSPVSFKLTSGSGAGAVITTLPTDYPATDFYGVAISSPAAAGAAQSAVSGSGYFLDLSVNNSLMGSISAAPVPNVDSVVAAGTVTITASPAEGHELAYWLVNGDNAGSVNPLSRSISAHTTIQAVFYRLVTVTAFTDAAGSATTPGTLRYALTNAQDGDIIRFTGVTAGTTTIELGRALPTVSKSVTIEGNGVTLITLTPGGGLTSSATSNISNITVNISRVHFKNGRATSNGAAVYNYGETVNLESCIFSGNQASDSYAYGGAIYNAGTMNIKGCTFYNNSSAYRGGAIYNTSGTLTLTGNLFYGNTAAFNGGPVVYRSSGTVTSNGYNVVNVALGTGTAQSGWTAGTGDTTFSALSISGEPFNTTTFAPVTGLNSVMPSSAPEGFPAVDFNGAARTWPGAPGAVKQ
jgi:hypothetical protein